MFETELVRPWTLDVRRMVRPERTGVLVSLAVYALVWGWGYSLIPHDFNGQGFSFICWFAPWACPKVELQTEAEIKRKFHVVILYPGHGKKTICSCHPDLRTRLYDAKRAVLYEDTIHDDAEGLQITCDSDVSPWFSKDWVEVHDVVFVDHHSTIEQRMHCDDKP